MTIHFGDSTSITSGGSKVVNVAQSVKTHHTGYSVGWGGTSGNAITLDYAASSSSNKLLIMCSLTVGLDFSGRIFCNLFINGSREDGIAANSDSNITRRTSGEHCGNDADISNIAFNYLKTSPSTSSITYSVRLGHGDNGTRNVYINRPHDKQNQSYIGNGTSSITIMEFAP